MRRRVSSVGLVATLLFASVAGCNILFGFDKYKDRPEGEGGGTTAQGGGGNSTTSMEGGGGSTTTTAPSCVEDGAQNGGETDIDCGGGCSQCSLGKQCTVATDCQSNSCADGVCCDEECGGTCESCNLVGMLGTCTNIPAGMASDNDCSAVGEACDGQGACKLAQGESCGSPGDCVSGFCVDGFCCVTDCGGLCKGCAYMLTGNPNGICVDVAHSTDPNEECPGEPLKCGNGVCRLDKGQTCTMLAECLSGNCVDGFCCDTDCSDPCKSCSGAKTGGVDGTCGNITAGTDPDNDCPGAPACNGADMCP